MRADMRYVVIERPRGTEYSGSNKRRDEDHLNRFAGKSMAELELFRTHDKDDLFEDEQANEFEQIMDGLPKRRSTSRKRWGNKFLTDLLGPLVGYLKKHVGEHWDKVNSDIHEHLKMTSAAQGHILDHIDQMVEKNAILVVKDGKEVPYSSDGRYELSSGWRRPDFYVCPKSGVLKMTPERPRFKYKRKHPLTKIGRRNFKEIDGVWYELTLTKMPPRRYAKSRIEEIGQKAAWAEFEARGFRGTSPYTKVEIQGYRKDVLFNMNAYHVDLMSAYGDKDVYCSEKKQLKGKEIDKLGLRKSEPALPDLVRRKKKGRSR